MSCPVLKNEKRSQLRTNVGTDKEEEDEDGIITGVSSF